MDSISVFFLVSFMLVTGTLAHLKRESAFRGKTGHQSKRYQEDENWEGFTYCKACESPACKLVYDEKIDPLLARDAISHELAIWKILNGNDPEGKNCPEIFPVDVKAKKFAKHKKPTFPSSFFNDKSKWKKGNHLKRYQEGQENDPNDWPGVGYCAKCKSKACNQHGFTSIEDIEKTIEALYKEVDLFLASPDKSCPESQLAKYKKSHSLAKQDNFVEWAGFAYCEKCPTEACKAMWDQNMELAVKAYNAVVRELEQYQQKEDKSCPAPSPISYAKSNRFRHGK